MNNIEIRKEIDKNNHLIERAMTPNIFVLNGVVKELLMENEKLQNMCTHDIVEDGFCLYCDKEIKNG